jgi:hypothetical protein
MSRHYDTSEYMAHWPLALPYPYEITRSRGPVPNASSVNWPQAQFAPLYLPSGSPSFQPYRYQDKPRRYPAGAKVFSIWPGPNTLPFSTKAIPQILRRRWMNRPDGDIIRVPYYGRRSRRNGSAGADVWTASDTLNLSADREWGNALSGNCQSAYLARQADANKVWQAVYAASKKLPSYMSAQKVAMQITGRGKYVQSVKAAQAHAVSCMDTEAAGRKEEEFQMLRDHKVETQQTSSDQAMLQADLMSQEAALASAQSRNKLITYGLIGAAVLGGGFLVLKAIRK